MTNLNILVLAILLAQDPASNQALSEKDPQELSPEVALTMAQQEASTRAYLKACIDSAPLRDYYEKLSERYLNYLARYGRLTETELGDALSSTTPEKPVCDINEEAVLQSILVRDASIRALMGLPSPGPEPSP